MVSFLLAAFCLLGLACCLPCSANALRCVALASADPVESARLAEHILARRLMALFDYDEQEHSTAGAADAGAGAAGAGARAAGIGATAGVPSSANGGVRMVPAGGLDAAAAAASSSSSSGGGGGGRRLMSAEEEAHAHARAAANNAEAETAEAAEAAEANAKLMAEEVVLAAEAVGDGSPRATERAASVFAAAATIAGRRLMGIADDG